MSTTQPSDKTLQAIAAYVPANVAGRLAAGESLEPGSLEAGQGVTLFADVAGFTPMAEQLTNLMASEERGGRHRGAEELNRIINQTFTAIIRPIREFGGLITRFSGDALTAYFPTPVDDPKPTIVRALHCAAQMQTAILPFNQPEVEGHRFLISIKIGMSYGAGVLIALGSTQDYRESLLAGPALDEASAAEHYARPGDIIAAPPLAALLHDTHSEPLADGYHKIVSMPPLRETDAHPQNPITEINDVNHFLTLIRPYLPRTIFRRTLATQGDLPGDYRRVSNIFVRFEGIDYTQPDAGQNLQEYIEWAHRTAKQHDGTLLRVLSGDKGSGLHITFGAPDQHPNDVELALRCALALRDDQARPAYIRNQQIGIASGLVFAATIGAPERHEYTVVGNEINLSARLMMATEPNTILVDSYSQERTISQFEFSALPPLKLKGKAELVVAYQLLAPRVEETGLKARYLASRWPLAGRKAELARLTETANKAFDGGGRIIALAGALGSGKTRLIETLARHWVDKGGDGFLGQSNQQLQNNPYEAWIGFWHDFFGFKLDSSVATSRQKITRGVAQWAPHQAEWVDALADILGLPIPETSPLHALDAENQRKKLYQLTLDLLLGRSKHKPLLALFEDLHWVDTASADLIDYVATRIRRKPVLLCLLYRNTHDVPVDAIAQPHCQWLTLKDLTLTETGDMIRSMLGNSPLAENIIQAMYDRTHGAPLYIEEIINNLIANQGIHYKHGQYRFDNVDELNHTPDTLQDLIRSRLDRLEVETRDLAQVAAVVNREFSFTLLKDIYPYAMGPTQLQSRLDELRFKEITDLVEPDPNPRYLFKSALTYEVAYNSVPFARRRQLHQRIAQVLEETYGDNLGEYFSILAYHYQQSRSLEKAFLYAVRAGERAQRLYANQPALDYFAQAETFLSALDEACCWDVVIKLYVSRAQIHRLTMDMAAAHADLDRAIALAATHQSVVDQVIAFNLKAELAFYQEQAESIRTWANRALALTDESHHLQARATALYHLGVADLMDGRFDAAMAQLQPAHQLSLTQKFSNLENEILNRMATVNFFNNKLNWALLTYQTVYERRLALGLKDKAAETMSNIATVKFRLGRIEDALETATQAVELAQDTGWKLLIPYVKMLQVELLAYTGRLPQAEAMMRTVYMLFSETDEVGLAYARLTHARDITIDMGRLEETVILLNQSLTVMRKYDIYEEIGRCLSSLGRVHLLQKQYQAAQNHLEEAEQVCVTRHKSWYLPEIYAHLGEALLKQDDVDSALQAVKKGLAAVQAGSNPNWHGPLLLLSADIARKMARPLAEISHLHLLAAEKFRVRSRWSVRRQAFIRLGNQLITHPDEQYRTVGEQLIKDVGGY